MQSDVCPYEQVNCDHRRMLYELKKSVDLWFLNRRDYLDERIDDRESCWQVLIAIKNILLDGLHKNIHLEGVPNYAALIEDLNWLTPPLYGDEKPYDMPNLDLKDCVSIWIYTNFRSGTLCARLQLLVADLELLTTHYTDQAFLYNDRYATALFICLSAIELNQSSLISQIDASLYVENVAIPKHKRSSSHPHFSISPRKFVASETDSCDRMTRSASNYSDRADGHSLNLKKNALDRSMRLREWKSLPNIREPNAYKRMRSRTISQAINIPNQQGSPITPRLNAVPPFDYNTPHNCDESPSPQFYSTPGTSKSSETNDLVPINLVKCDDIKIYFDQGHVFEQKASPDERPRPTIDYDSPPKALGPINFLSCISSNLFASPTENSEKQIAITADTSSFSNSNDFVSAFMPLEGKKLKHRYAHSIFEDVDDSNQNVLETRIPADGQSLAAFLQSVQFSRHNTELERENAHFRMSEAMICMIENMKWTKIERKRQSENCTKSGSSKDGFSARGKKKRRTRVGSKSSQINFGRSVSSFSEVDDSLDDSDLLTDGSIDDHCEDILEQLTNPNQNVNDLTAYAEWGGENTLEALSAEGVALSLISKFSDNQLPRASDITWLVSEKDAPQTLLPMPGSPSADPDENYVHHFLRGTRDWAPPRQQIIFTNHPQPNRKQLLQQQNYRCTGCGMRVSRAYMNRFRYCTYLGKYHCTGCHRNQMSTIPAKVLEKWDFSYYPVSVFAYRLLEQIWTYPLFYVPDLNPTLYSKIKNLNISKERRIQLKFTQDFIITCRFADKEKRHFENIATHITMDPDKWSMFDFVAAKDGSFPKSVMNLITKCEEHIYKCELCTARGFICELCPKKDIIFPWQSKIKRCDNCGTCFHQKCWNSITDCVKCQRLRTRKYKI